MNDLWPRSARTDQSGELWLGECAVRALADRFGTPLYVFDEITLREGARAYQSALRAHYPGSAQTAYAAKAFLCLALAQLWAEERLDLDIVSAGELCVALEAGFPPQCIHFHGNNKTSAELTQALQAGIGRIVVDNFHEMDVLEHLAESTSTGRAVPIWLRLAPGIQAPTHAHIRTGQEESKFGFSIASGAAEAALVRALGNPLLRPLGLHAHVGSQIYQSDVLARAASLLIGFAANMRDRHGFELEELSPGGGWGVPMTEADPPAPVEAYVAAVSQAVVAACQSHGLSLPHLVLEPGRSLVARAGVAVYRVGSRKEIPGVRTFIAIDGGMADNIRPALYGAAYTAQGIALSAMPGRAVDERKPEQVTLVGRYCESGDVLIHEVMLPQLRAGDLVAVPMSGAYTLAMASNYNLTPRPAVVMVSEGRARLVQRRESHEDLLARDLPLHSGGTVARPERTTPARLTRLNRYYTKYQALGNDYIVLDPADWPEPPSPSRVREVCDRHLGVGADGVLWGPIAPVRAPFGLRMYNPDGQEFEKSGNGLRIFARYLWDRGLAESPAFEITTRGGTVTAHLLDPVGERIAMDMGRLSFRSDEIGIEGPPREMVMEEIHAGERLLTISAVTLGNPHCVVFVDEGMPLLAEFGTLEALARSLGPILEHLPLYPDRTNVQFAQVTGQHSLRLEVWERGAGYTLASGTSSCAAAGAAIRRGLCASPVQVRLPGGELLVEIATDWSVRLTGRVGPVCQGTIF